MIALKKEFTDKLTILCFPCNQFGKQERGTNEEIKAFVEKLGGGQLTLMDKVEVNGPNTSEVYAFLKNAAGKEDITWNFKAYWLVDFNGNIIRGEGTPKTYRDSIAAVLEGKPAAAPGGKTTTTTTKTAKTKKTTTTTTKKAPKKTTTDKNCKEVKKKGA